MNCRKRRQQKPTAPYLISEMNLSLGKKDAFRLVIEHIELHPLYKARQAHLYGATHTSSTPRAERAPLLLSPPQKGAPPGGFISDQVHEGRASTGVGEVGGEGCL